jgi:PKD repeat protein
LEINHRPTCDFDYTPTANLTYETEITFTAKDVNDEDGDDIASYSWEFSDGGTGTSTSTKHTFAAGGSVWAKLTVEDARGLTGSKQKTFDVTTPPVVPVAKFSWDPNTPGVGDEVEFTDTSTTPTGTTITGWDWDFGDDEDSDEQNPKHTYSAGGTYTVSLTVTNSDTQTHTITHDIEVSALKPTADFDYSPTTPDVGDPVTFTDTSAAAGEATIESWSWNFGDGQTATVKNPTHTFDTMGTYTVTLTVTDSNEETSVVGPPVMMYSYPNPASNTATIAYRVPDGSTDLMLRVYNITGALVFEQELAVGASPYTWGLDSTGGTAQPNGLYLCVVVAKANGSTIKSPIFKLLIQR